MHSFQPSRGRVFFEVLCALVIAASFAGAWMQTGATALLPAAGATLLYAFVHLFDMRRRRPVEGAEPQRIDFEPEAEAAPTLEAAVGLPAGADPVDAVDDVAAAPQHEDAGRRKGGSRKSGGRRAKGKEEGKVVELVPVEDSDVAAVEAVEETPAEEGYSFEEVPHLPAAPLFEPEPFVRHQRVSFGRKSR